MLVTKISKTFSNSAMYIGLNVVEVAHDFQQQIRRYVVEDLKLLNSYDTWHGETDTCAVLVHIWPLGILTFWPHLITHMHAHL